MLMEEAVSGVDLRLTAAWKMASRGNTLSVHFLSCSSSLCLNSAPGAELGRPPVPVGAVVSWLGWGRPGWASCFFPVLPGPRSSRLKHLNASYSCAANSSVALPITLQPALLQQAALSLCRSICLRTLSIYGFLFCVGFVLVFFLLSLSDHIFTQPSHPKVHPSCIFSFGFFSRRPAKGGRHRFGEDGGRLLAGLSDNGTAWKVKALRAPAWLRGELGTLQSAGAVMRQAGNAALKNTR